jgi:hypothetical protein
VQLRRHIEQQHGCEPHAQRRAEDRIRDDHHDTQAQTLRRSLE